MIILNISSYLCHFIILTQNQSELLKCPFNPNHYLPSSSMEEHKKKCQCASFMGTSIHSLADDELTLHSTDSSFLYKDSSVESIQIGIHYLHFKLHL